MGSPPDYDFTANSLICGLFVEEFAEFFTSKKLMVYATDYWAMQDIPIPPRAQYVFPKKLNSLRANTVTDDDDIAQILLMVDDLFGLK